MDGNYQNKDFTLLAVLAHPDDETFGMGGTLAYYAEKGVNVHLICATRGESGDVDEEHMNGHRSVAEVREYELRCAASKLGITGVHFLDYRDSGMPGAESNSHPQALAAQPLEEVVAPVVGYIRKLRPQVILTFDPIGGYRHPDHIVMHDATVEAFEAAADPTWLDPRGSAHELTPYQPQKLYFHTISRRWLRWMVRLMPLAGKDPKKWGRNQDIDLTKLAIEDFPVHAIIDYTPVREKKEEASNCHSSQGGPGMSKGLMGFVMRLGSSKETFMRAYPPPIIGKPERDLFTGVAPEPVRETTA